MKPAVCFILGLFAALPQIVLAENYSCAEKRAAVETQIKYAQQYNDVYKIRGLKKALFAIDNQCDDAKFEKSMHKNINKLENKIDKKNAEIEELNNDLSQARSQGNLSKQQKYQTKLIDKQAELYKLNSELQMLKQREQ